MKRLGLTGLVNIVLVIFLCLTFTFSIYDTSETKYDTNFDQAKMMEHIEKLSENGPRSLFHKEANEKAVAYIVSQLEESGVIDSDTTDKPAYLVQEFVAKDPEGRYQNFYLKNVIVHIPANAENKSGEAIMFMGHFDSVPMGQGASDDGVACATMLEAIDYYLNKMKNGYTLTNDLVFCFVNGEEFNLYGSYAFMNEFVGFDDVVKRIRFGTNLESRGTDGTLIMFETAKNNYNTVKLFSEINESVFTCSIATMVYDSMPNGTDFSNFKEAYQGLNFANISGGENYHTQNDKPENVGEVYLSQQAQVVDALIDKLGSYELSKLYEAKESALFFSYLNIATVVYDHTASVVLAILLALMLVANILLSVFYRRVKNCLKTAKAFLAIVTSFALTAGISYLCYYLFQLIATLFGVIDIHMIGTITYSNTAIVIGIGLVALAVTVITTHFATKWLKIARRDLIRAFAYLHAVLGIALALLLPDAGYLFVFSGMLFVLNELVITLVKQKDMAAYHLENMATALYFPIVIPVIFLATTALGMTMAYVYGLVFALAIFAFGVYITPWLSYFSLRSLIRVCRKKKAAVSSAEGGLHLLFAALVIFLAVSLSSPNASVNLQGKQNIAKLPYDDALVCVADESGMGELRVYDLNAMGALSRYLPEDVKYSGEYYYTWEARPEISLSVQAIAKDNTLTVKKNAENSLVYLDFSKIDAESFTVDDGVTRQTYKFEGDTYGIVLHTEAVVTLNGGSADLAYKEVIFDYEPLIPSEYANDHETLHFNLWLVDDFQLG